MLKKIILKAITFYQKADLFNTPLAKMFFSPTVCRFHPTCSQYTYEAVQKYGPSKGLFLGFKRFLRCHPFSKGGFDPVP